MLSKHMKNMVVIFVLFAIGFGLQQGFAAIESEDVVILWEHLLYTSEPLTVQQLEECEEMHADYTTLEEIVFSQRYVYHKFAGNCVMLYEDPVWEVAGNERHNLLSERLTELVEIRHQQESEIQKRFFVNPTSVIELQIPGTYLYTFEGCTGEQAITASDIMVASDEEIVSLVGLAEQDREILPETCGTLEVQIRATDPNSIRILISGQEIGLVKERTDEPETTKATPKLQETERFETTSIRKSDLRYTVEPLSENDILSCERTYNEYITLDEDEFSTRYLHHPFMGNCVMLFDDPIWNKKPEYSRYQDLSERLADLVKEREQSLSERLFGKMTINTKSIDDLGGGMYLYTFEGCTGDNPLMVKDIAVESDVEVVSLVTPEREGQEVPAGICRILDIRIMAEDPNSIRVVIPEQHLGEAEREMHENIMPAMDAKYQLSPRMQTKELVPPNEIICNEGLQLMLKVSDSSPACVSSHAFAKLVERGWGRAS